MEDMVGGWGRGEKKARSKRLSQFQFFPISQALVLGHRNRAHKSAPKPKNSLICPRWVDTNFIINNNESSPGKWAFSYLHQVKTLCPWFIFGVCIGCLSLCDHKRIQKHKKYNINAVITFMVYYYSEKNVSCQQIIHIITSWWLILVLCLWESYKNFFNLLLLTSLSLMFDCLIFKHFQ